MKNALQTQHNIKFSKKSTHFELTLHERVPALLACSEPSLCFSLLERGENKIINNLHASVFQTLHWSSPFALTPFSVKKSSVPQRAVYLRERGFNILLLSDKAVLDRKHLVPGGQRQLTERKRMEITSIERLKAVKLVVLNHSPAPAYPSVASALQQHISRVC